MSAPELTAEEAAIVARFEAAEEPAELVAIRRYGDQRAAWELRAMATTFDADARNLAGSQRARAYAQAAEDCRYEADVLDAQ